MLRKSLYLVVAVCLMFAALPLNVAMAQRPEPPKPGLKLPDSPPEVDGKNVPEAVKNTVAMRESLTADQATAVRQILDKYEPELRAFGDALMAAGKPAAGADPQAIDKTLSARMNALLAKIDAEMAGILNADQLAVYRAGVRPQRVDSAANALSTPAGPAKLDTNGASSPQGSYTSYCYYGPIYNGYSWWYAYYAYLYGYYDYYYYGTSYGYYAYLYSYYGWYYNDYALNYAGPTYFSAYYSGYWNYYWPYYAYYYSNYAAYYSGYGSTYGYYDYYYQSGSTYAYYAYYYGNYANSYEGYATTYNYYCWYYAQ